MRPTFIFISFTMVVVFSAGYLKAIIPRGSFPVTPKLSNIFVSSILITTPSMPKGKFSLIFEISFMKLGISFDEENFFECSSPGSYGNLYFYILCG